MRSAMEVLLTLTPSAPCPPSPLPVLAARPARALLKAKKSPNFFFIFFVGIVVVVEQVVDGKVVDEKRERTSMDGREVSVDVAEGEVVRVVVDGVMSDGEEKGVELGAVGRIWAGFDSSHRPFLQWGDSRKSNRRKETLSTTTTGSRTK